MKKGHLVFIYKSGSYDCTAKGVTHDKDQILLECEGGVFDIKPDEPYLKLDRKFEGRGYLFAVPMLNGEKLHNGSHSMMGGNFIYSSDSRFRELNAYPIPVHDRFEF